MMEAKYCPSCNQSVAVEQTLEGNYLLTCCQLCGLGLGVTLASKDAVRRFRTGEFTPVPMPGSTAAASADGGPSLGRVSTVKKERVLEPVVDRPVAKDSRADRTVPPEIGGPVRQMRSVMLVEDSELLRTVTKDLLTERQLAQHVTSCPDGASFIEAFVKLTVSGQKPDLVILDVRMPGMEGREAAYAMRAIEQALGAKKTPILFFSAMLCDAEFKGMLREISNARYIRKPEGGDVENLGERIVSVLERLVGGR